MHAPITFCDKLYMLNEGTYVQYSSKVTWYSQETKPRVSWKWHMCKIDFCTGNRKLHIANSDGHRHAIHV